MFGEGCPDPRAPEPREGRGYSGKDARTRVLPNPARGGNVRGRRPGPFAPNRDVWDGSALGGRTQGHRHLHGQEGGGGVDQELFSPGSSCHSDLTALQLLQLLTQLRDDHRVDLQLMFVSQAPDILLTTTSSSCPRDEGLSSAADEDDDTWVSVKSLHSLGHSTGDTTVSAGGEIVL